MTRVARGETRRRWGDLRLDVLPAAAAGMRYLVVSEEAGVLGAFAVEAAAVACFDAARSMREEAGDVAPPPLAGEAACEAAGEAAEGVLAGVLPAAAERRAALRRDLRAALRDLGFPDDVEPAVALCGRPRVQSEALLAALRAAGGAGAAGAAGAGGDPAGLTPAELATRLGRPRGPVRALLYKLRAAGEVVATGGGRYAAAPPAGPPERTLRAD
jgi:hypothetical protein